MLIGYYEDDYKNLCALNDKWRKLSRKTRDAILILSGVITIPRKTSWRFGGKRGDSQQWLMPALNLLRDAEGKLKDREIAARVGVSPSTLSRNEAYQRAKKTYLRRPQ